MIKQNIKYLFTLLSFLIVFSLASQAQEAGDYNSVIKTADQYYHSKDYYNAKASYQMAVKLKPDEVYPQEKIQEIINLLKAEMAVRGEYDEYVELADEAFDQKDYTIAISNYEKALALIAYENHPNERLKKSKELKEANRLKKEIYGEAIKTADQHFINKEYDQALSFYRDAANVDTEQKYPNDQVLKITNIIQNANANQLAFEQAIIKADQQLSYQKFTEALQQYETAASLMPDDTYAVAQVAKMKVFIEKEKDYDRIAAKADELYVNKDFVAAKLEYQKAQNILPEKTYALNMISKIDASMNKEQLKLAKLEENYQKAITTGDQLFNDEKYQMAYSKYSKALELKPNEKYPKTQLEEIDILLASGYIELSCFVHENNKGLFDSRIQLTQGGRVIETAEIGTNGKHTLKLDLNKEYQVRFYKSDYIQKIFDINTTLPRDVNHNNIYEYDLPVELFQSCSTDLSFLDQPLLEISYYKNRGNFYYDTKRGAVVINRVNELKKDCKEINQQEEKKGEYDKLIVKADKYFVQEDYAKAIENYTAAGVVLPKLEYPKQKIAEIKSILEAKDKYQALIVAGDAKYNAKDYEKALYDYYEAKNLKPNEAYPQEKIAEIDGILNARKALDDSYLAEVQKADSLYQMDSLSMAITSYRSALKIKSKEVYPKNQISKIEQELDQRQELDKRYEDAIAKADRLFENERLTDAKAAFLIASQIKPAEMYPKYKIEDINTIEEQRKLRALDDNYASVLSEADRLFEKAEYTDALPLYVRATEIKPKESYPPIQIGKINELLVQMQADAEKYDQLIATADQQLATKEYAPSFDNYKLASLMRTEEQYPKDKMAEIEAIMKQLADLEMAYQELIHQADSQFDVKDWNTALVTYQEASDLKPFETHPKYRIAEINGILLGIANQLQANADKYSGLIATADQQLASKQYNAAFDNYKMASLMKAEEQYPKDKMAEIEAILKALADLELAYQEVIKRADVQFGTKDWNTALVTYQEASDLKPAEAYPKDRMAEINGILLGIANQIQADADKYDGLIATADQQLASKQYNAAFDNYKMASLMKADEQYPKDKMAEIEAILKALADLELAYQEVIKRADAQFDNKDWNTASVTYQEASDLKPAEAYPKERMAEINGILQGMADQEAAYAAAITEGDARFESTEWTLSLASYQKALSIKAAAEYPQNKIAEINQILKELGEKQAAYDAAIAAGDQFFASKTYLDSKIKYQEALAIIPEQEYPQQRIIEIDGLLKQLADSEALYNQLIQSGDALLAEAKYEQSLDQFKQALQMKPSETYPAQKVKEIEAILMALAEKDRLYTEAIAEADKSRDLKAYPLAVTKYQEAGSIKPNETYPPQQIRIIQGLLDGLAQELANYNAVISAADAEFDKQEWVAAKELYKQALSIKPSEVYPQTRIQEIDKILQQIAEKDAAYEKAIADADAFYQSKTWQESLTNYQLASQIKADEPYPKDRIDELNGILGDIAATNAQYDALVTEADLLFTAKDYPNARLKYQQALEVKKQESYPQERIQEIDTLLAAIAATQKQYDELIKDADKLFVKQDWNPSLVKYQEALQLKQSEIYPQEQINIINQKLQGIADQKAAYDALILEADAKFSSQDYENALLKYEAATVILVDEVYPKDKMKEIRGLLAELAKKNADYEKLIAKADDLLVQEQFEKSKEEYQKALVIFAERTFPQEQIVKIEDLIVKRDQYNQLIATADIAFNEKRYEESLADFQQANVVLPAKEYPPKRITEIETILNAIATTRASFDEAIRKGDANLAAQQYEMAKGDYVNALSFLSSEVYPRQKIMEIDQILQDIARRRMQYDKLIVLADDFFSKQSYDMALGKYTSALDIFPEEAYPQQKIDEIRGLLAQIADQQTRYDGLVEQGDQAFLEKDYQSTVSLFEQAQAIFPYETYPPQKIAEARKELEKIQRELDVAYQKAITNADKNFRSKKWDPSKTSYQEASDIKPEELYPKERLAEINSILEKELSKQQQEYDRYIADGERFYSTKYYQEAILSFEKSLSVFPYEKYPVEMIDKIFELIKKNSMVSILDGKLTILKNTEEKFKFKPISYKDRSENYILIEIKTLNADEQVKLYVNFGRGGAQNGGYSIRLKNSDGYHKYFVNIGKQVRWVSNDNDYISLLPEGGDVEVKLIKISRDGL